MSVLLPKNAAVMLLLIASAAEAGNILFLPLHAYSSMRPAFNVAEELGKQYGHRSTFVVNTFLSTTFPENQFMDYIIAQSFNNFSIVNTVYRSFPDVCSPNSNIFGILNIMKEMKRFCQSILSDEDLIQTLRKKSFKMAVIQISPVSGCFNILAQNLSIPRIQVGLPLNIILWRLPFMPSISSPLPVFDPVAEYSFTQGLINVLSTVAIAAIGDTIAPPDETITYLDKVTHKTNEELHATNELILIDTDPILDTPLPMMPNMVQVGGLTTRKPEVLTDPLLSFMDSSPDGVVIVAFGSVWSTLPANISGALIAGFKQIPSLKFVFKYGNSTKYDQNVMMLPWLPQNDLLSHGNTRAFITHCGHNSIYDAIYNAVPMIGVPLNSDQFYNAQNMHAKGFGVQIDACTANETTVIESVNEILKHKYKNTISKASHIFHSRPMAPSESSAFWIDHVIQYGGEHMRPPYLPFYQYYLIDVLLFLAILGICVLILVVLACLKTFRLCSKQKRKQD